MESCKNWTGLTDLYAKKQSNQHIISKIPREPFTYVSDTQTTVGSGVKCCILI